MIDLVEWANEVAVKAHWRQTRRDGKTPYIVHPREVVSYLQNHGIYNPICIAVAWLHDALEDNREFTEDILFGPPSTKIQSEDPVFAKEDVASLVYALTYNKCISKDRYMKNIAEHPCRVVPLVKLADRICNCINMLEEGDYRTAPRYALGAREVADRVAHEFPDQNDIMCIGIRRMLGFYKYICMGC